MTLLENSKPNELRLSLVAIFQDAMTLRTSQHPTNVSVYVLLLLYVVALIDQLVDHYVHLYFRYPSEILDVRTRRGDQ